MPLHAQGLQPLAPLREGSIQQCDHGRGDLALAPADLLILGARPRLLGRGLRLLRPGGGLGLQLRRHLRLRQRLRGCPPALVLRVPEGLGLVGGLRRGAPRGEALVGTHPLLAWHAVRLLCRRLLTLGKSPPDRLHCGRLPHSNEPVALKWQEASFRLHQGRLRSLRARKAHAGHGPPLFVAARVGADLEHGAEAGENLAKQHFRLGLPVAAVSGGGGATAQQRGLPHVSDLDQALRRGCLALDDASSSADSGCTSPSRSNWFYRCGSGIGCCCTSWHDVAWRRALSTIKHAAAQVFYSPGLLLELLDQLAELKQRGVVRALNAHPPHLQAILQRLLPCAARRPREARHLSTVQKHLDLGNMLPALL
mmetsp:Transcript_159745/g.508469  ORF Transcript_159745/g.508469 Transcript_159745/m.508469 type:complete len:367 (+) Transcript_159745:821-1921(+)